MPRVSLGGGGTSCLCLCSAGERTERRKMISCVISGVRRGFVWDEGCDGWHFGPQWPFLSLAHQLWLSLLFCFNTIRFSVMSMSLILFIHWSFLGSQTSVGELKGKLSAGVQEETLWELENIIFTSHSGLMWMSFCCHAGSFNRIRMFTGTDGVTSRI